MRIVSLLPSATEIVCALGLADQLVAVTHECDYPPIVRDKMVVTASALDPAANSATIDRLVANSIHEHRAIYTLDEHLLRDLRPDLILTQELCEVCAVSYREVQGAARIMDGAVQVVSLEPNTLDDILQTILLIGRLTGVDERARVLVDALQGRIDSVARQAAQATTRPRVYCMEWIDPPFRAGHWIPGMVRLAGGRDVLGREAAPSTRVEWDEIERAAPEIVVVMPCGFDADRAERELRAVQHRPAWQALPAVRNGQVWVTDGSSYFARPGPRMVDGLELLAHAVHPEMFSAPPPRRIRRVP